MKTCHLLPLAAALAFAQDTRQAMGVKVGEVTENSAIVWMRLTEKSARNADGAVPGAPGRVRVRWSPREDLDGARATAWAEVSAATDFSHQFPLAGLKPATRYFFAAETAGHAPLRGSFQTAPPKDRYADATFTVITGQMYRDLDSPEGYRIYESMLKLAPHFIVPTGDNVYYDNEPPMAKTIELARYHWQRMYSLPRLIAFHLRVPGYWEKDDHDTLYNDCWPTMNPKQILPMTFADGQRIFLQQVPMGASTSRTHRWGRALQIWLPEGRDFRSPNNAPDGPDKTIWGEEQKRWFKQTVAASDADWKVLVSPTPLVGPDRGNKGDNHANRNFRHEGNELRQWIRQNAPDNLFVACGDRHWQYHSVDPETGVQEFSSGPASDEHAGGSPGENKQYHRFHLVKGGFLSVSVHREGAESRIAFRFHDVAGKVVYEYQKSHPAGRD